MHWVRSQRPEDYLSVAGRYLAVAEAALERAGRRGGRRDVTFVMGGPGAWMYVVCVCGDAVVDALPISSFTCVCIFIFTYTQFRCPRPAGAPAPAPRERSGGAGGRPKGIYNKLYTVSTESFLLVPTPPTACNPTIQTRIIPTHDTSSPINATNLKTNQVLAIATATPADAADDKNGGLAHKPFEILYGASGYLTALLYLRAHGFTPQDVPDAMVGRVARWIVEGGEEGPGCVVFVWAGW